MRFRKTKFKPKKGKKKKQKWKEREQQDGTTNKVKTKHNRQPATTTNVVIAARSEDAMHNQHPIDSGAAIILVLTDSTIPPPKTSGFL